MTTQPPSEKCKKCQGKRWYVGTDDMNYPCEICAAQPPSESETELLRCPWEGPFRLHAGSEILDSKNRLVCGISNFANADLTAWLLQTLNEAWNRRSK